MTVSSRVIISATDLVCLATFLLLIDHSAFTSSQSVFTLRLSEVDGACNMHNLKCYLKTNLL